MARKAPALQVHRTRSLHTPSPRFPLEIHPVARLTRDGRLELLAAAFPPLGRLRLVLWHPGRDPSFSLVEGDLRLGWRWEGAGEGWVVLWVSAEDPATPF